MSRDVESDLRDRLRGAALPQAPAGLHERITTVAGQHPSAERSSSLSRTHWLMPIAAVLVIAAVAVSGWGGKRQPTSDPAGSGSPGPSGGSASVPFTIESRVGEWCSQMGGCEFHLELTGPGGPWQGKLDYADLGSLTAPTPRFPATLAQGSYAISAEIHVFGDAIPVGATGPPDLGTIGTCSSEFDVTPETTVVQSTLGFWLDRCSAGVVVTGEARPSEFGVIPSFNGDCGEFGCEYRVRLVASHGSWQTVLRTPKLGEELVAGSGMPAALPPGSYVLEASSHRMSDEPFAGSGHRQEESVAATCSAQVTVRTDELASYEAAVHFRDETCSITVTSKVADVFPRVAPTPIETPAASHQVTCEPNPTDLPGLDCERAVDAVLATLEPGHPPIETVHFIHQCWSTNPALAVDCAVQAVGIVSITFVGFSGVSRYGVTGFPWTGVSVTALSQVMFGPEYSAAPPEGHGVPIERAVLSDDKRALTVEFWGGDCFSDVVPLVGRSGEELHVGLFEVARIPANPQPSPLVACVAMAFRRTYHLVLPEPFTGSTVRDLNGGVLVLE